MKLSLNFHVLQEPDHPETFLKAAVLLTEKLYQKNRDKHLVLLCNKEDLSTLDGLLWTLIPESFLPHQTDANPSETSTSHSVIDLASEMDKIPVEGSSPQILINLSSQQLHPTNAKLQTFSEIHMIVGKTPEYREFCRTLFREYKKSGIPLFSEAIAL